MEQSIRIPKNRSALMQALLRHVTAGHYFWTADRIPRDKLTGFVGKWNPVFRLRAEVSARAYRKRTGRASVQLCISFELLNADCNEVEWWMLSTPGKDGLTNSPRLPGKVQDARTLEGRLWYGHYELLEQPKTFIDNAGKSKTITTWTWRLTPMRYREREARLVECAKVRDRKSLMAAIDCLQTLPMFAGIRSQVLRLVMEANKMLRKVGQSDVEIDSLPFMTMISLYADTGAL